MNGIRINILYYSMRVKKDMNGIRINILYSMER